MERRISSQVPIMNDLPGQNDHEYIADAKAPMTLDRFWELVDLFVEGDLCRIEERELLSEVKSGFVPPGGHADLDEGRTLWFQAAYSGSHAAGLDAIEWLKNNALKMFSELHWLRYEARRYRDLERRVEWQKDPKFAFEEEAGEVDYDELSPGIRDLVRELNDLGYETTDSGDGTNYQEGMECALPYRHVIGIIPPEKDVREFTDTLQDRYPEARIEASYAPDEEAIFILMPDGADQ